MSGNIDINKRLNWLDIDQNISQDYEFFNSMLELVSPQHYFPQEVDDKELNEKWMRKKRPLKEIEKRKKLKIVRQRDKLDPEKYKSVPQLLQEMNEDNHHDEEEDKNGNHNNGDNETNGNTPIIAGFSSNGLKDREEIKKKLMDKITELRKKRKAPDQNDGERQIKRQRTNKQKNNENKNHNKKPKMERIANGKDHHYNDDENGVIDNIKEVNGGNVENDVDEDIEFGTFDYSSGKPIPTYLSHMKKGPNKKILLQKAMEKQRMIEELKDTEEGKKMKDDMIYDTLIKRAQGIKVKDDPKKIKKSVKRTEVRKEKSRKEWDTRLKQQKKTQVDAIKRRESNIKKKIQRKKRGKSQGKPSRPGFEGKRTQPL